MILSGCQTKVGGSGVRTPNLVIVSRASKQYTTANNTPVNFKVLYVTEAQDET